MTIYDRKQWINWAVKQKIVGGKKIISKYPLQGLKSPETWKTYAEAKATGKPTGFWFTPEDPYFFIDIDHALKPDNSWSALAISLCTAFAGCYMEVSQSRTGLHIVGRGVVPPHQCKNTEARLELYDRDRFIAWTGTNARGDADHEML